MLNITKTVEGEKTVFSVEGRLDTNTAPEMEKAIRETIPEAREIVIDFEKLDYISSAGLRVLLSAHKAMSPGGTLRISNANQPITEIFEVTGFSEILNIG